MLTLTRFENNRGVMKGSCAQWAVPDNSDEEIDHIKHSVQTVAQSSGVDPRFILAVIMQESNGCVRVPTTSYSVSNPGLMQSHAGTGSCNDGTNVLTPCPKSQILQMVKDGAEGTASGAGLKQCLAQVGGRGGRVSTYYRAARCYNSGSVAPSGNLGQGIATPCYVSDIANRLLGWSVGPSHCKDSVIGSLTGSSWIGSLLGGSSSESSSTPEPSSTSEPVATPTPALPTETVLPAATSSAEPTPTPSASSSAPPIYPSAISSCQQYTTVVPGDYCDTIDAQYGISIAQLRSWNTGLDAACSNLWAGYQYCVKA